MPDSQYIVHQPFLYPVGPLEISGFGLAMLMCFVTGHILLTRELSRRGHDPAPVGDLVVAAAIGGLLGAKIYYAILTQDMGALFSRAGFVFWGGLIGGIIAT
ncbi:MAG: prolipoprotein diacylglyceryl transferase family protein, partial [Gemmatimonadaceae bacterium]